jgi:hypothetical protein
MQGSLSSDTQRVASELAADRASRASLLAELVPLLEMAGGEITVAGGRFS